MSRLPLVRTATLAVVAAASVGLVACSSSTSTTTASSTTAPPATTAAPATTRAPASTTTTEAGSTEDTEAGGATPAACRLVTQADAEAAFGEPAVAGTQSSDECWWSTANDLKTINVIIREPDLDSWRQGHANDTWESVSGLGDEAFASKALDSVEIRVGDTVYEINVVYSTKGDPKAVVQQLSETVASRV